MPSYTYAVTVPGPAASDINIPTVTRGTLPEMARALEPGTYNARVMDGPSGTLVTIDVGDEGWATVRDAAGMLLERTDGPRDAIPGGDTDQAPLGVIIVHTRPNDMNLYDVREHRIVTAHITDWTSTGRGHCRIDLTGGRTIIADETARQVDALISADGNSPIYL
jgi:hypothetical protein